MTLYYLRKGNQGYYRPDSHGYTDDMLQAGLFSEWTAKGEVAATHGEVTMIPECPPAKPEEGSYILASTLASALEEEIIAARRDSYEMGSKDESAYIAGLEANLSYLRRHKTLTICS